MVLRPRLTTAAFAVACLAAAVSAGAVAPPARSALLVGFMPGTSAAVRAAVHASHGSVVVRSLDDLGVDEIRFAGTLPQGLAAYRHDAAVEFVEENAAGRLAARPPTAPNDPTWSRLEQWRLRRSNALIGWRLWPGSYYTAATKPRNAIKVAVLDGRIDAAHPDFRNAGGSSTDARAGGQLDLADRANVVPPSRQAGPVDWHGTFIAGLIGASTNNGRDVAGIAYGAQVMPVTVADGNGIVAATDAAAGILHAISRGARVINMSFAISGASATLQRAVERAGAAGAVLVAAAGNNGSNAPMYPAAYARDHAYVMAVSATNALDSLAPCSNYNSYVTVAAPGANLMSLAPGGGTMTMACGTSAATAFVSGAAAAVLARTPGLNGTAIRTRIAATADDVESPGRDPQTGFGRLNLQRALDGGPVTFAARPKANGPERSAVVGIARSARRIAAAEWFVDHVAAPGRGTPMRPGDGAWNGTAEHVTATVNTSKLSEGVHDLFIRARDRDGRWGPAAIAVLVVDRTAPEISTLEIEPAAVVPGDSRTRLVLGVTDALSRALDVTIAFVDQTGVTVASFRYRLPPGLYRSQWRGTYDAPGSSTFTRAALPPGAYTVRVTAVDESGRRHVAETRCVVTADTRT